MASAWASALSEGKRPDSWQIYNPLHGNYAGVIVPSFACRAEGIRNLVLWAWADALPHRVVVIDPTGRLPKNQRSWE